MPSLPFQSCDSWMVVTENPDRKKKLTSFNDIFNTVTDCLKKLLNIVTYWKYSGLGIRIWSGYPLKWRQEYHAFQVQESLLFLPAPFKIIRRGFCRYKFCLLILGRTRSSRSQMFWTLLVFLKLFTQFHGKYLCWSPFNKDAGVKACI